MRRDFPELELLPMLADCGDPAYRARAVRAGPDSVIHAAACKQVPMLEEQVRAALRNNVQVTAMLARACRARRRPHFLLVSTDKAIEPVSVLGASKRLAEMACQALARRQRHALGDRALRQRARFRRQRGAAVPRADRARRPGDGDRIRTSRAIFMTIPEACQLILQTVELSARDAAVFTLDMGQPVRDPRSSPSR